MEERLRGGNTHDTIIRVGSTVRRPTGHWTPGVHALLDHLAAKRFEGAPRVHDVDEEGREILDFVNGTVVHPDHDELLHPSGALAEVAGLIRDFHDAVFDFDPTPFSWSDRGADPSRLTEIVCHNDLAPWNLVHRTAGGWAFIDWDLAAPGRRSWDLAWAILSLVPLLPGSDLDEEALEDRLALFRERYGADRLSADVIDIAVERCERETTSIETRGAAGESPYHRLLAEGHAATWRHAAAHIAARATRWASIFRT